MLQNADKLQHVFRPVNLPFRSFHLTALPNEPPARPRGSV
jgi:hypothetical protein